jgi:hypothetical protein
VWEVMESRAHGADRSQREPTAYTAASPRHKPDILNDATADSGAHEAIDVKCGTSLYSNMSRVARTRGSVVLLAAQEAFFLKQMFGSPTSARPGDYSPAVGAGTEVVPLIHNLHGGRSRLADRRMRRLARKCGNAIAPDEAALSSVARRFLPYFSQRLSCAAVMYVAHRVRTVLASGTSAPTSDPQAPASAAAPAFVPAPASTSVSA